MKISLDWVKEYTRIKIPTPELKEQLTLRSVEIDAVTDFNDMWKDLLVGEVIAVRKHPGADKLSVAKVDTGLKILDIVCGGRNLAPGQKVAVALPGTILPNGTKIEAAIIRGQESEGMICSSEEIGLMKEGERHILVLDESAKNGVSLAKAMGITQEVLNVDVLPNRPDLMGHLGMAREIAAITGAKFMPDKHKLPKKMKETLALKVDVPDSKLCPRYSALVIDNVTITDSPAWIQNRLRAIGLRPINTIVDLTNYLAADLGLPFHAFDYDKISGATMKIRASLPDETLVTLDGVSRSLPAGTIVIADKDKVIDLAGIMGGQNSAVSQTTKRIVLQTAVFDAGAVRKASRLIGHRTDAVALFEKGVDGENTINALAKAYDILKEQNGDIYLDRVIDEYPKKRQARYITFTEKHYQTLIGEPIETREAGGILEKLGFEIFEKLTSGLKVSVPSWRPDVKIPEDAIEEVARIQGYDSLKEGLPFVPLKLYAKKPMVLLKRAASRYFTSMGFQEAVNYAFLGKSQLKKISANESMHIPLQNPMNAEQSYLRTELVSGLIRNVESNLRHTESVRLFEVGHAFFPGAEGKLPQEKTLLTALITEEAITFYAVKGIISGFFTALQRPDIDFTTTGSIYGQRGTTASVMHKNTQLGDFGLLTSTAMKNKQKNLNTWWLTLDLNTISELEKNHPEYKPLDTYPAVLFDVALIVDQALPWKNIEELVRAGGEGLVGTIELFDTYIGEQIPPGKKSLAFHLNYQSLERTLTKTEIDPIHEKIIHELTTTLHAQVREK